MSTVPDRTPSTTLPLNASRSREDADLQDREWMARIRIGDESAFAALYQAYKNDLGAYVISIVRSREVAEEVIHDLFLRMWEHRHTQEIPGAVSAYLFRAARNRALDYIRHERITAAYRARAEGLQPESDESVTSPTGTAELETSDLARALDAAVGKLPPRCREVFLLNRKHHKTYAEVASVMGISPKTVEAQMARALRELRAALAPFLASAIVFLIA